MRKLGLLLVMLVVSLTGCGATGSNKTDLLTQARLLRVVNDYYYLTLLYKHNLTTDQSSRRVEGVKRVTMAAEDAAAADITAYVTSGLLTQAKLDELKVVHSLSDERCEELKSEIADTWYVNVNTPTIPSGATTFEVTLKITGAADEVFTTTVELARPAQMGLNIE